MFKSQAARSIAQRTVLIGASVAFAGALAACASVPAPTEQQALAQRAVDQATAAPATAQAAPVEIQSARDKLAKANQAMTSRDYVDARRLYEEASADARLAEAKGQNSTSQQAVTEVQNSIQSLHDELNTQQSTTTPAR